jgi:hypothetical protein
MTRRKRILCHKQNRGSTCSETQAANGPPEGGISRGRTRTALRAACRKRMSCREQNRANSCTESQAANGPPKGGISRGRARTALRAKASAERRCTMFLQENRSRTKPHGRAIRLSHAIPPGKWSRARGPPTPAQHGRGKSHGGGGTTAQRPRRAHAPRSTTAQAAERAPRARRGAGRERRDTKASTSGAIRRCQTQSASGASRTRPQTPGEPGGGKGTSGV